MNTISQSAAPYSLRDRTLFAVLAFSGIRKSEALALRISDYDSVSRILYLPKAKNSSKRFQTIPHILSCILDNYLEDRFKSSSCNEVLPIFSGQRPDAKLSSRQASNIFLKWKRKSGIRKNLTIHSFRASYAARLYQKTRNPLLVSYALGHTSFDTTKRYINEDVFDMKVLLDDTF